MELEQANKIMGEFNTVYDNMRNQLNHYDKKRLYDRNAGFIFEGLRFAFIELSEFHARLEEELLR